uniref:Uncharacterized protein n=1 Tax=Zea mays TaxID=4577 RepID=B8A250_MAIZE|nr:unknown [Zea mays]
MPSTSTNPDDHLALVIVVVVVYACVLATGVAIVVTSVHRLVDDTHTTCGCCGSVGELQPEPAALARGLQELLPGDHHLQQHEPAVLPERPEAHVRLAAAPDGRYRRRERLWLPLLLHRLLGVAAVRRVRALERGGGGLGLGLGVAVLEHVVSVHGALGAEPLGAEQQRRGGALLGAEARAPLHRGHGGRWLGPQQRVQRRVVLALLGLGRDVEPRQRAGRRERRRRGRRRRRQEGASVGLLLLLEVELAEDLREGRRVDGLAAGVVHVAVPRRERLQQRRVLRQRLLEQPPQPAVRRGHRRSHHLLISGQHAPGLQVCNCKRKELKDVQNSFEVCDCQELDSDVCISLN